MADSKSIVQNALCAVAGALITGLFSLHTSSQNTQLEREKLELQRQLQDEKRQNEASQQSQKLRYQTTKDLTSRKQEHREKVKNATSELRGAYWTVLVKSHCEQAVQIAWRYEALDGVLVAEGWFTVLPEMPTPTIKTKNPQIYYYARTGMFPNVTETPQERGLRVQWDWTSSFVYLDDEFQPSGKAGGDFQGFLIQGKAWGPQTLELACNSFTRRPGQ
jgi:hypothetical protein